MPSAKSRRSAPRTNCVCRYASCAVVAAASSGLPGRAYACGKSMPLTRCPGVGNGGMVTYRVLAARRRRGATYADSVGGVRAAELWRVAGDLHRHDARPVLRHEQHARDARERHLARHDLNLELGCLPGLDRESTHRSPHPRLRRRHVARQRAVAAIRDRRCGAARAPAPAVPPCRLRSRPARSSAADCARARGRCAGTFVGDDVLPVGLLGPDARTACRRLRRAGRAGASWSYARRLLRIAERLEGDVDARGFAVAGGSFALASGCTSRMSLR